MKSMKILHVASFTGNIGDNVSHNGLKNIISTIISCDVEYTDVEIRRFYNNYQLPDKLYFDEGFVSFANTFDLLIIGGGGFLDFWVENSETGTTINISEDNLKAIKVPTIISSVGCIPHRTVPDGNIEKFVRFLNNIICQENICLAIRNDGSLNVLKNIVDEKVWSKIPVILDNGFFYQQTYSFPRIIDIPYIAINTTLDQLKMNNRVLSSINYDDFVQEMVAFIKRVILETNWAIVFTPHIYSDIKAVQEILSHIDDYYIRTRINIAPYVQGEYGCSQLLSVYKYAEYVVGMRFHANVCSIAMNKSVSGFAALDRVIYLYDSVDADKLVVPIDTAFSDKLFNSMLINKGKELSIDYQMNVLKRKKETLAVYKSMFEKLGIIK